MEDDEQQKGLLCMVCNNTGWRKIRYDKQLKVACEYCDSYEKDLKQLGRDNIE